MSVQYKLAWLGVSAIIIFILTFILPNLVSYDIKVSESVLGKIVITYVVIAGVTPWIYLLETTRKRVSTKQFFIYFIGTWLMAPYFLFKMASENS